MGKITLLVSREEMLYQAHNILQEKKYPIKEMRVIRSESAVTEARRAIADGASIIIARGLQASLIKQYTDIPVVEIVLTAQEMALLVMKARQIIRKPRPVIGVVGFQNMFCDMSYFDQLYDIDLRTYYLTQGLEQGLKDLVRQAAGEGADLIIGGDTAVEEAARAGVPSLFLSMTEDSLRNAFSMAQRMEYAMEVEKKSAVQIETLLDYTFHGVIRLDRDGRIAGVNSQMEDIIGSREAGLAGRTIGEIAPEIGEAVLERVLGRGKEYSLFLELNRTSVFAMLVPILYDGRAEGAMITCHRVARPAGREKREREKNDAGLYPAPARFEDLLQESPAMKECVHLARLYALSDRPVVILGEEGTERDMMAQSIHNCSRRADGPFVQVCCRGLSDLEQREQIFEDKGAAVSAQGGTLVLEEAGYLTEANQNRLFRLIRFGQCQGQEPGRPKKVSVRVMVTLSETGADMVGEHRGNRELYYLLSGLVLKIPPLRKRREDLKRKLEEAVRECCDRYGRFHVLTQGAKEILLAYPWKGNLLQADSFCERLILTAEKRSVDEIRVRRLLLELYGEEEERGEMREESEESGEICEEAGQIARILKKQGGSREKTARELGISKATLWRKMKKYGIDG